MGIPTDKVKATQDALNGSLGSTETARLGIELDRVTHLRLCFID
jgi:hypothetical protein